MSLLNCLKSLIKTGNIVDTDDSQKYQISNSKWLGTNSQKVQNYMPFGFFGTPGPETQQLLLNIRGNESNVIGLPNGKEKRIKKDTLSEEVGLGNTKTGTNIYFKDNGDVVLEVPSGKCVVVAEDGNVTIDGTQIELNGNSKSFVTYAELNTALQGLVTKINLEFAKKLDTAGSAGTLTLDISASETQTIKTGG